MRESKVESASDGAERALFALIDGFSPRRADDWLRAKFPSFDASRAEPLDCAATKSEKDYFAEARLLGFVARLPESGTTGTARTTATVPDGPAVPDVANRPLVVAAIKMRRELTERTSRLVQFNYAKKVLQGAIAKGALGFSGIPSQGLFFFYDKDGYFRLSLVTAEVDKRKLKWNAARRQSFFVEPGAANNIVKRRLMPPIRNFADLGEAFSVEQLTKEFYRKLFDWYSWAMEPSTNVHFPNDLSDKTDDRKYNNEAVIRLITRLMFTWFIRQRKLVPDILFDSAGVASLLKKFDPASMEQDNYYRAILQNLFFATFNCQPEKRRFIHVFQGKSSERHVTTLYRYEKEFKGGDGSAFRDVMRKVPFLNCALFDCLDKKEREEDGGRELYFDGFSGEKGHSAHMPNGLFFDDERGIISLFNRYEFTVNENDADDADVALDPELLGKVFENLLGAFNPETKETARKATGSFYTPREIVDYMVEESLKGYLKTRLAGTASIDAKLADLFDRNKAAEGEPTPFSKEEKAALLDALYECRVLDPACGSGAFPMGVLHCMVRLLTRLDPQNIAIRERLLKRYREDKASLKGDSVPLSELEARLREGQHFPDYERKLYLIENCIYGVDIQPIATQISKLRFFISLLCDQLRTSFDPTADNFGLLSLPNLEAKFVCANTLISLPEVGALDASVGEIAKLRADLQDNRHKIFSARSTAQKEKCKAKDLEIRDTIRKAVRDSLSKPDEKAIALWRGKITDARKRRKAVAEPDWVEEYENVQADLFSAFERKKVRKDRNEKERNAIDAEIRFAEGKIAKEEAKGDPSNVGVATQYADMVAGWDPYDQNKSESWFDPEWMFNITGGFNVVIGNPPYISHDQIPTYLPCKNFEIFEPFADIYCYFFECCFRLLSQDGFLSFITSNSFLRANYGLPLRKYLAQNGEIRSLINIEGNQVFDSAVVNAVVSALSKAKVGEQAWIVNKHWDAGSFQDFVANGRFTYQQNDFIAQPWTLVKPEALRLRQKIESGGESLEKMGAKIRLGLATGDNKAFVIDEEERKRLIGQDKNNQEIIKPVLRGQDIQRYSHKCERYIILTKNGINVKRDYPVIYSYLDGMGDAFKTRGARGEHWTNLRACAFFEDFKREKIVWIELTDKGRFSLSSHEEYLLNSAYFLLPPKNVPAKYLLGILNSSTICFYMQQVAATSGMGTLRWINNYVKLFPIPQVSAQTTQIIKLVDKILVAKKVNPAADTSSLESEIDKLVYKLYGLTGEEIEVVEGKGKPVVEAQREESQKQASPRKRGKPAVSEVPEDDEVLE